MGTILQRKLNNSNCINVCYNSFVTDSWYFVSINTDCVFLVCSIVNSISGHNTWYYSSVNHCSGESAVLEKLTMYYTNRENRIVGVKQQRSAVITKYITPDDHHSWDL